MCFCLDEAKADTEMPREEAREEVWGAWGTQQEARGLGVPSGGGAAGPPAFLRALGCWGFPVAPGVEEGRLAIVPDSRPEREGVDAGAGAGGVCSGFLWERSGISGCRVQGGLEGPRCSELWDGAGVGPPHRLGGCF